LAKAAVQKGLEGQPAGSQGAGTQPEATGEKSPASLGASQNPEQLCSELSEIVSAWPKLSPESRNAAIALLCATRKGK
jgi:hypothetical protein